jgi:Zn-dependent M28 family amino/carboxypeptidase
VFQLLFRDRPARSSSREFVLLGSYMDAWGGAASCNAVGVASTLEAARVLSSHLPDLRRGVEFA